MSFARPELFLLLLLVPLVAIAAQLASRSRGAAWRRMVATRLEPLLVRARPQAPRWISLGLALLAFALLIAALSGPQAGYEETSETIRGRNVLIAIDVSRSMLATDASPNRLAVAKATALELLDRLPNDRIGIVAFSGTAWLQAPLTIDHGALRETFEQLAYHGEQEEWLPRGGSDIPRAVDLALETFKETGQRNNALIILSDGENHEGDLEGAAERAREDGVTIFTVGFGTDEGSFLPAPINLRGARGVVRPRLPAGMTGKLHDENGNVVLTRLDESNLRTLARGTGGFYTPGTGATLDRALTRAVDRLERFELEGRNRRVEIPRFQWFLLPAIVLLIVSMLVDTSWRPARKGAAALVLLAALGFVPPAQGGLLPRTAAEKYYERGEFDKALELFQEEVAAARGERRSRLQLGEAAAAYRSRKFTHALRAYSGALLSRSHRVQEQAHFGLGNTHFQKGRELITPRVKEGEIEEPAAGARAATIQFWRDSISHYDGVLSLNPDHREARENRELVRKLLEDLLNQQEPEPEDPQKQQGEEEQPPPQDPPPDQPPPDQPPPGSDSQQDGQPQQPPPPPERREDESPEEYARRVLGENADFQNRPVPLRLRRPPRSSKNW